MNSEKSRHAISGGSSIFPVGPRSCPFLFRCTIGWKIERGEMMTNLKRTPLYPAICEARCKND